MAKDKPKAKRPGWYNQMGVNKPNFTKLNKLRSTLSKAMGVKLSWNDFHGRMLPYIESAVKKEIAR